MIHQRINLPESHPDYPSLWQSKCGKWRVIRCVDDIQNIVQRWQSPYWRSRSYHVEAKASCITTAMMKLLMTSQSRCKAVGSQGSDFYSPVMGCDLKRRYIESQ